MKTIIFATGNNNKVLELQSMFKGTIKVKPLAETGVTVDFEETGSSFLENSIQKALYYSRKLSFPVLADDSGLEIDPLNGEPGIYSARYFDAEMPYSERCTRILEKLSAFPNPENRTARFRCAAVCAINGEVIASGEGVVEGYIALHAAGQGGFGYDPIFYYPPFHRTFSELTAEEKNRISHRKRAFEVLAGQIIPRLTAD